MLREVISASRRVDLVACYPDYLVETIQQIGPQNIHTLVLWTKNPSNLLTHAGLSSMLGEVEQLYLHLTITGLGGSCLERAVPTWDEIEKLLPEVMEVLGSPARCCLRYDPLMEVLTPQGARLGNLDPALFESIIAKAGTLGIPLVKTSYITFYNKVRRRMKKHGFQIVEHPPDWVTDFILYRLKPICEKYKLELQTCTLPNLGHPGCIDGRRLSALHPQKEPCSLAKDRTQRADCGCTKSKDIGRWFACHAGCLYCYGNPTQGCRENPIANPTAIDL